MRRVTIYGLSLDPVGRQPIVLLRTVDGARVLPIWIGHAEAQAILLPLQGKETPRPMTHDLLARVLGDLGATVERVEVVDLRDNTYFARICLRAADGPTELDARPSDALALALRCNASIYVADEVLARGSVEAEEQASGVDAVAEDAVAEFRRFLEDVRPDDFRS